MKNPKEVKFTWVRFGKASLGDWYVSRGYTYKWVMTSVSEKEYDIYTRTETPAEAWKPGTGEEYLYIQFNNIQGNFIVNCYQNTNTGFDKGVISHNLAFPLSARPQLEKVCTELNEELAKRLQAVRDEL